MTTTLRVQTFDQTVLVGMDPSSVQVISHPQEETICFVERKINPKIYVPKMVSLKMLQAAIALASNP